MKMKFRYQLEALLKKRRLDSDIAKAEEASARTVVGEKRKQVDAIGAAISAAEQRLREDVVLGGDIDRENRSVLATYLTHQHDELKKKQLELDQAVKVHEEIVRSVEAIYKDVKTLEKHKDNRKSEFIMESQRVVQRIVDELWLSRIGRDRKDPLTDEK